MCAHERQPLFGRIESGELAASRLAEIVAAEWGRTANLRPDLRLDEFVIMPNHVHGIILIARPPAGAQHAAPLRIEAKHTLAVVPQSLGAIVRAFKSSSARRINALRGTPGEPVWQRNYYERVLRNDRELDRAREYIVDNPRKWAEDKCNPDRRAMGEPHP